MVISAAERVVIMVAIMARYVACIRGGVGAGVVLKKKTICIGYTGVGMLRCLLAL
jgi:deoxycytidylate deaminase